MQVWKKVINNVLFIDPLTQEGLPEVLWSRFEDLLATTELQLKMKAMCKAFGKKE